MITKGQITVNIQIVQATRASIGCAFGPFFGPLARAPSDVGLDQGNHWTELQFVEKLFGDAQKGLS